MTTGFRLTTSWPLYLALAFLIALFLAGAWIWAPDLDRGYLESRYLERPGDYVEAAGTRLHVRDRGPRDAPAVVLVHGFGASLHSFDAWAGTLEERYRVVRLDLPGSGLSPPDPGGDYTDARSVALLTALLDRLGTARASIVGHSIGGRIAWTFAAAHPERVDRLVLISPDGFASAWAAYGRRPHIPASARLMRFALPKVFVRCALERAFADPHAVTDALVTRYYELARAPGSRAALLARMEQTVLVDPVPVLKSIWIPTLVLWGRNDALIPFSNAADYAAALPDATVVALDGVGHVPQEEAPEVSVAALLRFLH